MFRYYFLLGARSLRRNPMLTALMVLTLAVGVAASISTLAILHAMSANPLGEKSARVFVPVFDNGPLDQYNPADRDQVDTQLSYRDSANLLASTMGVRRTALYGISLPIEALRPDLPVNVAEGIAPTRDFFTMFDVPFRHGQAWSEADDQRGADVAVLSAAMAETLFGTANPVGKRIRMVGASFQIVGVLAPWRPLPKFYRLVGGPGPFGQAEDVMIPFATAIRHEIAHAGGMRCTVRPEPGWQGILDSECTWMQVYIETRSASDRADLQTLLDNYASGQRKLRRMLRAAPNDLYDISQWLVRQHVVDNDSRLSAWLAFGFLLLCLVNTIGLLLAKFSARAAEVGVRRALGASRRAIFQQFLTEAAVVGVVGGVAGVLLALGALRMIGMQSDQAQATARMDWQMLLLAFAMSLAAALLAGLLPTWRACQVTPAIQLTSQ